MNYGRELLKGNTDSLLLCLISRQPTYGYQIVKELEKRSNGYFQFKEGTLYPALHRLERDDLITGKWQILPNGQQRRYYYITENGQHGVAQELYTHLEEKTQELEEKGLSKEEASEIAVQSLGSPELIAKQIYETHAQGSWKEALIDRKS